MIHKQKPLYDRVIVQRLDDEKVSNLIVREVQTEKPMRAKVIAVGPGRLNVDYSNDQHICRIPCAVKPGDIVLIGKYVGTVYQETDPKTFKTQEYVILREDDILTIFAKEKE
jgi:co-chaperonin GroES (HSP10)